MEWQLSAFADEAGSSCEDQIAALQKAGLKRLDLRNMDGHNCTILPVQHAREVKKKLDDAGLQVAMWGSPIGKIDIEEDVQIDIEKLRHLANLAPILDCRAVRIFSYFNKAGASHDEWQSESLRRLSLLRDEAADLDLILYHENERHIFGDLGDDVVTIGRELRDGPDGVFRLIFDFDNFNQSGENVWETWGKLSGTTDAIHLKDSNDKQHTPVGMGTGAVREILTDALSKGWSGPLSIEPHLNHSGAVAATGPSGVENQAYGKMPAAESFAVAVRVAQELLQDIGAQVA